MRNNKTSTARVAALLAMALGASVVAGCGNMGENRRMGAGPMTERASPLLSEDPTKAPPRGAYGPGTVMPGGTQGPAPGGTPGVPSAPGTR